MLTAVLIIYIIFVFASYDVILKDRILRPWPRFFLSLVWPFFWAFVGVCLLAVWLLTLPERLG